VFESGDDSIFERGRVGYNKRNQSVIAEPDAGAEVTAGRAEVATAPVGSAAGEAEMRRRRVHDIVPGFYLRSGGGNGDDDVGGSSPAGANIRFRSLAQQMAINDITLFDPRGGEDEKDGEGGGVEAAAPSSAEADRDTHRGVVSFNSPDAYLMATVALGVPFSISFSASLIILILSIYNNYIIIWQLTFKQIEVGYYIM